MMVVTRKKANKPKTKVPPMSEERIREINEAMFTYNPFKNRRDPRLKGNSFPPWAYTAESIPDKTSVEFMFHPDIFKTNVCNRGAGCQMRVCAFIHPGECYVPRWRATGSIFDGVFYPPLPITYEWFKFMMLEFKTKGPCPAQYHHDHTRCHYFHADSHDPTVYYDRREPVEVDLSMSNFKPLPKNSTQTARQYHPSTYKMNECKKIQTQQKCPKGRYCSFNHLNQEYQRVEDHVQRLLNEMLVQAQAQKEKNDAEERAQQEQAAKEAERQRLEQEAERKRQQQLAKEERERKEKEERERQEKEREAERARQEQLAREAQERAKQEQLLREAEQARLDALVSSPQPFGLLSTPPVGAGGITMAALSPHITSTSSASSSTASGNTSPVQAMGAQDAEGVEKIRVMEERERALMRQMEELKRQSERLSLMSASGTLTPTAPSPSVETNVYAESFWGPPQSQSPSQAQAQQQPSHLSPSLQAALAQQLNGGYGTHASTGYYMGGVNPAYTMANQYNNYLNAHATSLAAQYAQSQLLANLAQQQQQLQAQAQPVDLSKPIARWSKEDVRAWVAGHSEEMVRSLATQLYDNDVDGELLLQLDQQSLKEELGVTSLGKRKKLLAAIALARAESAANNHHQHQPQQHQPQQHQLQLQQHPSTGTPPGFSYF